MNNQIDFLTAKRKESFKQQRFIRELNVGSLVFLVFYCLIVASVIFLRLKLRQEGQAIESGISLKKARINELKETESLTYVFKQRLSSLAKFTAGENRPYFKIFSFFMESINEGIDLKKIDISPNDEVSVNGQATNANLVAKFLEKLIAQASMDLFSSVRVNSLTKQKDGTYLFNIALITNEKL